MRSFRIASLVRMLLALFFFGSALSLAASDAEARAGGGSRGGRSYRSAPSYNRQPQSTPPMQNAPQQRRGGFMSGLAGGLAGGFLGSMLFSSLGFAGNGAGGGGMGFIEIILIAALAYFAFRWWKNRQLQTAAAAAGSSGPFSMPRQGMQAQTYDAPSGAAALMPTAKIAEDDASDIFFKVQGAWTRRDLSSVRGLLGPEIFADFDRDISQLKAKAQINRLENIAVRKVDVIDSWADGDEDLVRVRFTANLLDYVVDDKSGEVIQGSAHEPVKFEEEWIFKKHRASVNWQLVGIDQV